MKNAKLKSRKIHGKDYVEVNERLRFFRQNYPSHSIITEIIKISDDQVVIGAKVLDPDGKILSTGHAHEEKAASNINKTSYVENGETSAIGRALGIYGIGIDGGVASADEVDQAIAKQNQGTPQAPTPPKPSPKNDTDILWTAQELFGAENPALDAFLVSIGWLQVGQDFTMLTEDQLTYAVENHESLLAKVEKLALANNAKLRAAVGGAIAKGDLS